MKQYQIYYFIYSLGSRCAPYQQAFAFCSIPFMIGILHMGVLFSELHVTHTNVCKLQKIITGRIYAIIAYYFPIKLLYLKKNRF